MSGRRYVMGAAPLAMVLITATGVRAGLPPLRATSFGQVVIEPSRVSGVLWLDRDFIEAKEPIDRDGDMQYNEGELLAARGPLTFYINEHFFVMWDGKIHPIAATSVKTEKRLGLKNDFLKVSWVSEHKPNGSPVSILSHLLRDGWREARTMLYVTYRDRREIWVLSPENYFDLSVMGKPDSERTEQGTHRVAPRRYGCVNLCLLVELKSGKSKCPRCGSVVAEVRGSSVPGAGYFGLHGGVLRPAGSEGQRLEALLSSREELRVYVTNEKLEKLAAGNAKGSVDLWTDEMATTTRVKSEFQVAANREYLVAKIPAGMILPIRARCMLDFGDGAVTLVDFFLPEVVEVAD